MTDEEGESSNRSFVDRIVQAMSNEPRDLVDLDEVLQDACKRGVIDGDTLQMSQGVFKVVDKQVRDIMVPRAQMIVVEQDMTLDELLSTIVGSGHSRFPVIGEDKDDVLGVLLAKDLLKFTHSSGDDNFSLKEVLRSAVVTPESKRLNVLLKELRSRRNHMAIVLDEYGGVSGLVTIEDVVEEIVGEIDDEHDADEGLTIRDHGDGRYSVRALTPIEEFNATLNADLSDEDVDTIGGLVMNELGHMPKPGESTSIGPFRFKVLAADSRRVHLVQVTREDHH